MSLLFVHTNLRNFLFFVVIEQILLQFLYGIYHWDTTLNDYFRQQQNELSSTKWLFLRMRMT